VSPKADDALAQAVYHRPVPHEIEDRVYGPGLTPEERAAIAARVSLVQPDIVVCREMPRLSPTSMSILFDTIEAQIATLAGSFVLVLDISQTRRPDAPTRATLRRRGADLLPRVRHTCVVLGGDVLMNAVARLVLYSLGYRPVTFHDSLEGAMVDAVRAA
jgi:hypothetical protein